MADILDPMYAAALDWGPLALEWLVAVAIALIAYEVAARLLARVARFHTLSAVLAADLRGPLRNALLVLVTLVLLRTADGALPGLARAQHLVELLLIAALTVAGVRVIQSTAKAIVRLNPADVSDNLEARRIGTQVMVLSRTLIFLVVLIGAAVAMMTLPTLKGLGASLLASAGIAGLAAGLAAKPVLGNLLAGLQIAFTQPIRLDDVVIMQGEWGRIEEITSAYVVVRLWDERRLIVPLQWVIENPFQNWTRMSSELLGSAFVWVDYATPVDLIREEAKRICAARPEWDGKLCVVHVTDANETALQVRILVSARNAGDAFDLRCALREGIAAFLAQSHPDCLPQRRLRSMEPQERGAAAAP